MDWLLIVFAVCFYLAIGLIISLIVGAAEFYEKVPKNKKTQVGITIAIAYPIIFIISLPKIYKYIRDGIKTILSI